MIEPKRKSIFYLLSSVLYTREKVFYLTEMKHIKYKLLSIRVEVYSYIEASKSNTCRF